MENSLLDLILSEVKVDDWITVAQIVEIIGEGKLLAYDIGNNIQLGKQLKRLTIEKPDVIVSKKWRNKHKYCIKSSKKVEAQPEELVKKDREITLLKAEYGSLKTKYAAVIKAGILEERVLEVVTKEIKAFPPFTVPKVKYKVTKSAIEEANIVLGDSHIGEYVSSEETMGIELYNFEIFVRRLQYIADMIKNIKINELKTQLKKLNVICVGDMVSGEIHDELMITNELLMVEQVVAGAFVVAQFLLEMAQVFPEVHLIGVSASNHGRLRRQKQYKQKWANWDYIFYEMLAAYCSKQKTITFDIPKSLYWIGELNGHKTLVMHGDDIKSWMQVPWYGIERMVLRLRQILSSQGHIIKYVFLGHFHQTGELPDAIGEKIINGAFLKGNEFSIGKLGAASYPCQHFFGMHPIKGRSFRYPLDLSFADMDEPIRYVWDRMRSIAQQARGVVF